MLSSGHFHVIDKKADSNRCLVSVICKLELELEDAGTVSAERVDQNVAVQSDHHFAGVDSEKVLDQGSSLCVCGRLDEGLNVRNEGHVLANQSIGLRAEGGVGLREAVDLANNLRVLRRHVVQFLLLCLVACHKGVELGSQLVEVGW